MSWPLVSIGDAPLHISDGNYSAKYPKAKDFKESGTHFLSAKNLINGQVDESDCKYISSELHETLKKGHVETGDVLLTTRGNIGTTAIVPERLNDANINAQLVLLRPDKKSICSSFLRYVFHSQEIIRQISSGLTGTALKQLPIRSLKSLQIPLPPLAEQQKIAAILDAADSLRQKDQQLIEHYTALSQSLFLEMFGDPVGNPMGWESCPLAEVSYKITDGTHKTPKYVEEGVLFLSAKNIKDNRLVQHSVKYITQDEHDLLCKRCDVEEGDILITKSGSIGMAAIVDIDTDFSIFESLALIKYSRSKINGKFLLYFMNTPSTQYQYSRHTKGVGVKHLHLTDLRRITIILPPFEMQTLFTQRIEAIEQQKQQAQANLEKSEALFNSLLQRAFKGELTH